MIIKMYHPAMISLREEFSNKQFHTNYTDAVLENDVPLYSYDLDGVEVHESFQYLVAYEQISLVFVDFVVLGKHHGQWAIEEVEDIMRNIYDENGQINPDYASEMLS